MALKDLTDRGAVLKAIEEFEAIGREAFLDNYGFGKARSFFLVEGGKRFDSKAIAGAAHGYQHGHSLQSKDFSGGERSVARVLKSLGFVVLRDEPDASDLVTGALYSRSELHDRFGGQEQGGIATPTNYPVILAFTGSSGAQHGYTDGWSDGVFCYFGEGQVGPMTFTKGNLAIRDQAETGKDVLVFEMLRRPKSSVKFLGAFSCGSWEHRQAPDRSAKQRQAIVFHLLPINTPIEPVFDIKTGLAQLRDKAEAAGSNTPERTTESALSSYIRRSAAVRDYALARAAGICERCNHAAPFHTEAGNPFLEVHHIRRLSDGGPDRLDAVAAICPNCHREVHYGQNHTEINDKMLELVRAREVAITGKA